MGRITSIIIEVWDCRHLKVVVNYNVNMVQAVDDQIVYTDTMVTAAVEQEVEVVEFVYHF